MFDDSLTQLQGLYTSAVKQRSCELGSTWYGVEFQRTFVNSDC